MPNNSILRILPPVNDVIFEVEASSFVGCIGLENVRVDQNKCIFNSQDFTLKASLSLPGNKLKLDAGDSFEVEVRNVRNPISLKPSNSF
jgi:hypothetical protein